MAELYYVRMVGLTLGALVHLFLLVLIAGSRRPRRAFEWLLFATVLTLFLFHSGALLAVNTEIHYPEPPETTWQLAIALMAAGLGLLPGTLVHLHVAYAAQTGGAGGGQRWFWPLLVTGYAPLLYFLPQALPELLAARSLEFLWPGGRMAMLYGVWSSAAVLVSGVFHLGFARRVEGLRGALHRTLAWTFAAIGLLTLYTYAAGEGRSYAAGVALATAAIVASVIPGVLLAYGILRHNLFLLGSQRQLIYAVTATFLALLYLGVVRRISAWAEPVLPPEATVSILLFVLLLFFEPLRRSLGRLLERALRTEVSRLEQLAADAQSIARAGDLARLGEFVARRAAGEFGLAGARLVHPEAGGNPAPRPGARRFQLDRRDEAAGWLEVESGGAPLAPETAAALELLAERLAGAVYLCRLIEEKVRLERELAERERLALVGQLAASISHNLKNPLGAMKTILQVQLEKPELPAGLRRDCEMVVAEIDRLSGKLAQLLRFARPAVRPGDGALSTPAVAQAEELAGLLRREAERRNVRLEVERPAEEIHVRAAADAWNDILSNLLVNAIEAAPAGGTVRLRLAQQGGELLAEVTDDGPGVPAGLRERIFEPFFTTRPSGTGLGLAIVARRLAELGGAIRCESPVADSGGARFIVTLPLAGPGAGEAKED